MRLGPVKGIAYLEAKRRIREARRALVPEGMDATFSGQHEEARNIAEQVARSVTPNVTRDYPMFKRVQDAGGNVTTFGTAWLTRYGRLADIAQAEALGLAAIRNAASPQAVLDAMAALQAVLDG